MVPKAKGKGKGPELVFDDKARAEYLTGFRKRKQERKQAGRDYLSKKAKEEQLVARKELRAARKEKAAENVREQRKAFGLEAEGESDLDGAGGSDDGEELVDHEAVPQIQQEEYDSDEHHTHVVVESFDPEQEAFDKAIASTSSAPPIKAKANGQSEETNHPHEEEDVTKKRLHISGLTASFSKEDLIRRFSTFGTVTALDGLGKQDALGQFRPYAYLTLQGTPQQIKRCMNLLSGSVWKGATLRIGEAKPDYEERAKLEKEKRRQEDQERANNPKKLKRLPVGMGLESKNMDPIGPEAVENGLAWGWKRTPAGHLVRPLRMRPAHPLPRPSRASTLFNVHAAEQVEPELEASSSRRPARVNPRPPTKAHRITIDPTRYGAVHLSGPLLESLAAQTGSSATAFDVASLGPGEWHCEEIEGDDVELGDTKDHRLVRWQYTAHDGKVMHEEFIQIPIRVVAKRSASSSAPGESVGIDDEDVMAQLDFGRYSDAGSDDDLFSGFASSITPTRSQVEAEALKKVSAVVDSADIDDLFAGLPASSVQATSIDDLFSDLPPAPTLAPQAKRAKLDKEAATPTASKAVKGTFVPGLDPEEDGNFSDGYDEVVAAGPSHSGKQIANAEEERKKTLLLLGEMFGSGSDDRAPAVNVEIQEASEVEDERSYESSSASMSDSENADEAVAHEPNVVDAVEESDSSSSSSDEDSESKLDEEDSSSSSEVEEPEAQPIDAVPTSAEEEQGDLMQDRPLETIEVVAAPCDAKSRRAAFLSSLSDPASTSAPTGGSFVPTARFDPGTRSIAAPAVVDRTLDAATAAETVPYTSSDAGLSNAIQAAPDANQGTRVSMSTLKQMFRPQEGASTNSLTAGFSLGLGGVADSAGGFSLMDSLGLFELEEEEAEPEPQAFGAPSPWSSTRFPPPSTTTQEEAQPKKYGFFFPSSSSSTPSWNKDGKALQRWKPRSQEQREADWTRYKESLTQVVKKRHREAARKQKRGFRSLPKEQQGQRAI